MVQHFMVGVFSILRHPSLRQLEEHTLGRGREALEVNAGRYVHYLGEALRYGGGSELTLIDVVNNGGYAGGYSQLSTHHIHVIRKMMGGVEVEAAAGDVVGLSDLDELCALLSGGVGVVDDNRLTTGDGCTGDIGTLLYGFKGVAVSVGVSMRLEEPTVKCRLTTPRETNK